MSWTNIKDYLLNNDPWSDITATEETVKSYFINDVIYDNSVHKPAINVALLREYAKSLQNPAIDAVLMREYAKSLAEPVCNNTYIYFDSIEETLDFALDFIMRLSKVYKLKEYPYSSYMGTSIKELIAEYDAIFTEKHHKWTNIRKFLIKLPTRHDCLLTVKDEYLDQYAVYYENALRCFLAVLATVFNLHIEQPKLSSITKKRQQNKDYELNLSSADNIKFQEFLSKFDEEYAFAEIQPKYDFKSSFSNMLLKSEGFRNIHLYLRNIDFTHNNDLKNLIKNPLICSITFENSTFNTGFMEMYSKSFIFKNCLFKNKLFFFEMDKTLFTTQLLQFDNCVFLNPVNIGGINNRLFHLIFKSCNFSPRADLYITNIKKLAILLQNVIFEGIVVLENNIFDQGKYTNVVFLNELRTKNLQFSRYNRFGQIIFGLNVIKTMKHSLKTFIQTLRDNGYSDYAAELEQFYLNDTDNSKNKDEIEIAIKSDWVSIRQAAIILGISYNTLLTMRKNDKANGIIRIPFKGEGKSSKYYYPLLKAYKSGDMKLVNQLAREMENTGTTGKN